MSYSRKITLALAAAAAFGTCAALMAQDQSSAPPPPPAQEGAPPMGPMGGGPHHGGDEMRHMARELNLSPQQREQIKGIMKTAHEKGEAIRSNTALSQDDRRQQMMANHKDTQAQIRAALTPDQQQKFDAMQAERREHWKDRQGMQPPPPPPPAQ